MARSMFIPPGGFTGFAQQTMAVRQMVAKKAGTTRRKKTTTRRRKKAPVKRRRLPGPVGGRKRVVRKKRGTPARMVKGSAAAKRHMAKLRKMRRG